MLSFLALYRGDSIQTAELVAVTTDNELVGHVAQELLRSKTPAPADEVLAAVRDGKRRALEQVQREVRGGENGSDE